MRYLLTFLISLFSFFALQYFEVNNVFVIATVLNLIFAELMYPMLHVTIWETNIDKPMRGNSLFNLTSPIMI